MSKKWLLFPLIFMIAGCSETGSNLVLVCNGTVSSFHNSGTNINQQKEKDVRTYHFTQKKWGNIECSEWTAETIFCQAAKVESVNIPSYVRVNRISGQIRHGFLVVNNGAWDSQFFEGTCNKIEKPLF